MCKLLEEVNKNWPKLPLAASETQFRGYWGAKGRAQTFCLCRPGFVDILFHCGDAIHQ
jgi:hypothetical protein